MKHPALTSALSVVLTVLCAVQLFVGVIGFGSAESELKDQTNIIERIEKRLEKYNTVKAELDENDLDYDTASESLVERQTQHNSDASDHKTDLSIYTATRSGEIQAADKLWEAKAAMSEAWAQFEAGEAAYNEQRDAFYEQYNQFMAIKPVIEAAMPTIDYVIGNSDQIKGGLTEVVNNGSLSDEQYFALNMAYKGAVDSIIEFQNSENYQAIAAAALEAGIDLDGILNSVRNAEDENGNIPRNEANEIAVEAASQMLNNFDNVINSLNGVKAILDNEQALVAAKEGIDQAGLALAEGRKQLESGEGMLQSGLEYIWYELGKLDDQKEELEEKREALVVDNAEIQALEEEVKYYDDLTKRVRGARNMLMVYPEIKEAVDNGMEIEDAAAASIRERNESASHEYEYRRIYSYIAIAAAVVGILSMFGAFEKIKLRNFVFFTAIICMLLSICAEYLHNTLGINSMYITIVTPIFALLQALTVIPSFKKKSV